MYNHIGYIVLFISVSYLIDITFSGGFNLYHKYKVIELLYMDLSRQSSTTDIMSTNFLVMSSIFNY